MRVALVTGIFPPDIGGPATYVPAIARALAERGHDVRVVTTSEPADITSADADHGFGVVRIDRRTTIPRRTLRVTAAVARAAQNADVVYANGMFLEAALGARLARRPLVIKVVGDEAWERSTARGWTTAEQDAFQDGRLTLGARTLILLRNAGIRAADHVIVPSRYLQRIVAGWGVDPQRCHVIYNAVGEIAPSDPMRSACGPLRVLTAGRLIPLKGFDLVIRALREVTDATLDIAGDGPCRSGLEGLVYQEGLGDRVRFLGQVTPDVLYTLMQAHDVFVLASRHEGLPHVVLEAMQHRMAVVATRTGGTPEVLDDGTTGLLVNRSADELRDALVRLQRDPQLRRRIADAGRAVVERRFGHQRMVAETEHVLTRAARGLELLEIGSDRLGDSLSVERRKKLGILAKISVP